MLTDIQKKLVDKAIDLGYGYRKFALNVKLQDWCSTKQQITLENIVALGEARRYYWTKSYYPAKRYKYGEADYEEYSAEHDAMMSNEYF